MSDGPWSGRRLHLIGVGGAGMSAYARAAHALGATVSGSDRASSPYLEALRRDGVLAAAYVGHDPRHLPEGAEVVPSSAIGAENPELRAARERGMTVRSRGALLGELSAQRRTIAVAGTHGKTTTASMVVEVLRAGGLDPGYLIGGIVRATGTNAQWTDGQWLVVEADESDRSLLELHVEIAVLTNVELDHHAAFGSELELREVYRRFLAGAPQAVIWDQPPLRALREGPVAPFDVPAPELDDTGSRFRWRGEEVRVGVPGAMNALNAAAALEAALLAGVPAPRAAGALRGFQGAGRRLERVGSAPSGAALYDDYAHHPTEVRATLDAARTLALGRVVAVFQPHLFSRTRRLAAGLGAALATADVVCVLEIYPARERAEDHIGVSGLAVAAAAAAGGREVYWLPTFADARRVLPTLLRPDDVVLFMGAGDIDALSREVAHQ
jgi:UDP-N-acetylmuramate--alanine ligase